MKKENNQINSKTSSKVLAKIVKKDLKPRPAWHFYLARLALYISAILAMFLGALALAIISYLLIGQDWTPINDQIIWPRFFLFIPYAWLIALILFYLITYFNIGYFPRAYKFSTGQVLAFVFLGTILLAIFLNSAGLPAKLHENFSQHSPGYRRVFDSRSHPWQRPDLGFLAGEIIDKKEDYLLIRDLYNHFWIIRGEKLDSLTTSTSWRFIGEKINNKEFRADQIRPWMRQNIKR